MKDERVVAYVSAEVLKWLRKESAKLGLTESAFMRVMIMEKMRESKGK